MFFLNFLFLSILDLILTLICSLFFFIFVLLGVAFFTLMERKILGYIQLRKGPNKVGLFGVFQPFSDAIKLFSKEQIFPIFSNYLVYYFSPIFSLFFSLICWFCLPLIIKFFSFNLGVLYFLCILSLGVYPILVGGWSSNSLYSLLGGLRAIAQTISYEVSLVLILFILIFLIENFNFIYFFFFQKYIWFMFFFPSLMIIWFLICLAETNRAPFDFAEGESELVSGFNVEYSSGGFALIFLAEYASILFMSTLFCLMFLGGDLFNFFFFFKVSLSGFLFIWVRGTFPRFRYDKLMYLAWKIFLPFSLNFLFFVIGVKIFFLNFLFF